MYNLAYHRRRFNIPTHPQRDLPRSLSMPPPRCCATCIYLDRLPFRDLHSHCIITDKYNLDPAGLCSRWRDRVSWGSIEAEHHEESTNEPRR